MKKQPVGRGRKYTNQYLRKIISRKAYKKAYRLAYLKGKAEGKKRGTIYAKFIVPAHNLISNSGIGDYMNSLDQTVEIYIYLLPKL